MYPNPSKEYHFFTDALNHTWSGVLTQQWSNSERSSDEKLAYHPIMYQSGTFSTSQLKWSTIVKECYTIMMSFQKLEFYWWDTEVILRSNHDLLEKLIKNQTKNTLTQNWAWETFPITPYITFKYIKGKDNILADSLTQLQRLGLYEKCPHEEDSQDKEMTIFGEGESIKVAVNPDSFTPPDLSMILSVTNETSANANHNLDKDTFILDDVTYVIYVGHQINPKSISHYNTSKEYNYMISHWPL